MNNKQGCPSLEDGNKYHINKAIETADLLWIDDSLAKPFSLEGKKLFYLELSSMENKTCNIDNFKIRLYEEGE